MDIFASSFGLASGKPWAPGVARSAIKDATAALFEIQCSKRLRLGVNFETSVDAMPKIVIDEGSADETLQGYLTFPVAKWTDRKSARPIATSTLVSCIVSIAENIGAGRNEIIQNATVAGIEICDASPTIESFSDDSVDLAHEFPNLDPILTSATDECGPVGNDTGADVVGFYRQWRLDGHDSSSFFPALMEKWDVSHSDPTEVNEQLLLNRSYDILTFDDAAIGCAFAQFFVDGTIELNSKHRCLTSISRQKNPLVIQHRGWSSPTERLGALSKMETFINELDG